MNSGKGLVLVCLMTALFTYTSASALAKETAQNENGILKEYLDRMWCRMMRTWGTPAIPSSDFASSASFELDTKGNVGNIAIENAPSNVVLTERLRRTITNCAPFPLPPIRKGKPLHVHCQLQSIQGAVSIELHVAEFAAANPNPGTISPSDLVKGLVEVVRTGKAQEKIEALQELKKLGAKAETAAPAILEATRSEDSAVCYRAFEALQSMGPTAKSVLPDMIKNMSGSNDRLREQSVLVIATMGPAAEEAIPLLLEALDDNDTVVQKGAAKALQSMGAAASHKAVDRLMSSSFHEYITFTPEIVAEFGAEAVPALIKGTEDADAHVVHHSVEALQKMGNAASPAVPALIRLIDTNYGGEAEEKAIETLGNLGSLAKTAVPSLVAAVQSVDEDNRWRAIEALGCIGPEAREALPVLQKYLNSTDADLRRRAKEAVRKISNEK